MASEQSKRDLILGAFHAGHNATAMAKMFKVTVSQAMVFKTIENFKATGKTRKMHAHQWPVGTAARTKRIREKLCRNPERSMRQLAKESVGRSTMWKLVRKDLGHSFIKNVAVSCCSQPQ